MFWGVGKIRGASTASLLPGPSCCADAAAIGESEHWTKRVRARGVKQRRAGIKNLSCFGKMWKTEQNEFGKYEICMLRVSNKFMTCFFAPWSLVCLSGKYSSNYCLWWHHPVQYDLASGVCCYMFILGVDAGNGMMESTKSSSSKEYTLITTPQATMTSWPLHLVERSQGQSSSSSRCGNGSKDGEMTEKAAWFLDAERSVHKNTQKDNHLKTMHAGGNWKPSSPRIQLLWGDQIIQVIKYSHLYLLGQKYVPGVWFNYRLHMYVWCSNIRWMPSLFWFVLVLQVLFYY